jgi:acyl-CoA synthetase (AMP-forming)/AMP-acid ligase II
VTLSTSFSSLLEQRPEDTAFVCLDQSATRAQLAGAADHMAGYLKSLGITRGDTLCVWLPDGGTWLQILFAAARLGVLVVPVSTRLRFEEALHVVKTAQAKLIFVQPQFVGYDYWDVAHQIKAEVSSVEKIIPVQTPAGLMDCGSYAAVEIDESEPGDLLCTFSTSGTTGNPKLATHSQWGILHHVRNVAVFTEVVPGDASLCALPLYGVLGFVQAFSALAGVGKCVFMQTFNTERAAKLMDEHHITHFYGGEGLFDDIVSAPGCRAASLKTVGFAEFAGRGLEVTQKAEQRLGLRMTALYGSSECFAIMAGQLKPEDAKARAVAGGQPISSDIEFRVADIETGQVLPEEQRGELQFRGYNVMAGYLNNPTATADAFTQDGWFKSGDLGFRYGKKFAYISRIKDTLRLRGYLVDPVEIEEFLSRHPGILDAQVVAWRHPERGDVAVAFLRKLDPLIDVPTIHQHCRSGLANYKVPSHFVFVDDYPRKEGPNGLKILKNKIRDMAKDIVLNADTQGTKL